MSDYHECQRCHSGYELREGEEPTGLCGPCAQEEIAALRDGRGFDIPAPAVHPALVPGATETGRNGGWQEMIDELRRRLTLANRTNYKLRADLAAARARAAELEDEATTTLRDAVNVLREAVKVTSEWMHARPVMTGLGPRQDRAPISEIEQLLDAALANTAHLVKP